jgi:hypothetical protein
MGGRTAAYRQTSVGIGIGRYTASLGTINSLLKVSEPEVLRLVLSKHARRNTHAKGEAETTMNSRLEELRKRLMPSETTGATESSDAIFTRSSQSAPANRSKQPAISDAKAAEWNSDAQDPPSAEPVTQQKLDNEDGQAAIDTTNSMDQRAQIVATLFEPAHRYRERLSTSFESIRTLHLDLGVLAQSFEPLGVLHDQVVDFLNSIQAQLTDMAKSLETAKALRQQLSELVQALDAGSELHAQTCELSKALGVALQAKRKKGN